MNQQPFWQPPQPQSVPQPLPGQSWLPSSPAWQQPQAFPGQPQLGPFQPPPGQPWPQARPLAGVPHVKKDPKMGVILSVLLFLVLLLGSGFLFLIKTGGLTTTSTSHPSTTTSQTPLATPGIGVPVVGGNWEVTIKRVHQESKLNGNFGIQTQTYTPHSGFTFLVVDIKLRNLASPDQVQVSTKMFALLGSDGTISTPDLVGAAPGLDNYAPGVASITSYGKALEESLVFVLEETQIRQVFQFQFQKVPLTHETIM